MVVWQFGIQVEGVDAAFLDRGRPRRRRNHEPFSDKRLLRKHAGEGEQAYSISL